jgi:A/G-specific adenine glycosylase
MIHKKRPPGFEEMLRHWFHIHGRRGLPWRDQPTPYRVLVSEFMLQQTTVATVLPKFDLWIQKLPDIHALASASENEILKLWEGLGYYSRARNLQRAAQAIVSQFDASTPSDPGTLAALPGIGPYTAAAVAAFAFDKAVPVLDANINRVIARLFDIREDITTSRGRSLLHESATCLLPENGGRDHTSALMDLGATICRAGKPDCSACPLITICRATDPTNLPVKKQKKSVTHLTECRALALQGDTVFLIPSPGPRWQGLWLLPPGDFAPSEVLHSLTYPITRYRVRMDIVAAEPSPDWMSFSIASLPPMPSPHRKAIAAILKNRVGLRARL